ncbi:phosphatase PAP2 family protein [Streptomyces glomeratus]|uniref:Phosphatase PAP2 family protein n=1 Tax=Streptomyces glomeratus TaxID=284452 RepID=A0ABP6LM13_9ACTN|nr:phosphatase PAP2 family protein [Streptomyces glomeratus]MCF1509329.1 phosphatase PAP2 family protein [Streptomyces glomeratus]
MKRADAADLAGSVAVGALAAFALLTLTVTGRDGSPLFGDEDLLEWSVGHRPHAMVAVARALTSTGTGVVPYLLAALAGLLAGRTPRQRGTAVAAALLCLAAGQAVRSGVMTLVARPRPAPRDWVTHASGWAFPSGHTTTAAVAAGLLALAILARARRGRAALVALVLTWGVLVGLTRVYLGVHWFSDVLGGWLFALCWLSLCVYAAARLGPRTASGETERSCPPAAGH